MLDSKVSLEKALLNFPKWMDIRKRSNTSNGGLLLESMIKEIDDIQSAINDYKKDFFIINYIGKEDTIIDYLYVANIGDIKGEELKILSHIGTLFFNIREFIESKEECICYTNGNLLFKNDSQFVNPIKYRIGEYVYSTAAIKTHIWNIFDEFAIFSGIKRQNNESNKDLLNRTLLVYRNRPNSSDDGIKNSIINLLSNKVQIDKKEISIERPMYDNLFKEDISGNKVIDVLADINKDTFNKKMWDINKWEHNFKDVDYVYPKWDIELEAVQDGVGYNDSLKTRLISEIENNEFTDVNISLYQKDSYRINEFIRNNKRNIDIDLELIKYKNELKPININYKILASTVEKINSPIYIDSFKNIKGDNEFYINDIVLNESEISNIIVKRNKLEDGKKYKLRFLPKSDYCEMIISKCNITGSNSLLKANGPYIFNNNGELINSNVKLHANSIGELYSYKNIVNYANGMTLEDSSVDGNIGLDLSNMQGQYFKIKHSCRETNIIRDSSIVKFDENKFEIDDTESIVSKSGNTDGTIEIELNCSQFFMEMTEGNCIVSKTINGETMPSEIWFEEKTLELNFDSKKDIKITITKLNNSAVLKIRNIRYARYDMSVRLKYGEFINTPSGKIIPLNFNNNFADIAIKTYTGFSPEIEFIHIGSNLSNAAYETEVLIANNTTLDIESNCRVELIELDNLNNAVNTTKDYVTKDLYENKTMSPVFIQIDVSKFVKIINSIPAIDKFSYNGKMSNFIKISPGEKFDKININGESLELVSRLDIFKELKNNQEELYISQSLKGIVVKSSNDEFIYKITKDKIEKAYTNIYKVSGLNENVTSVFVIDEEKNIESITDTFDKNFEFIYFAISNQKQHVAYNSFKMVKPEVVGVNIINLFNPFITDNELYVYEIEQAEGQTSFSTVLFEKQNKNKWSLGRKTLCITLSNTDEHSNYESEINKIRESFVLSNNINLDRYYDLNGRVIDIAEYIINPPVNMKISYQRKRNTGESIIPENDGFNKLKYSNIASIVYIKHNGIDVDKSKYILLEKEGIIQWTDNSLVGEQLYIDYNYDIPAYLTFKSYDSLYELVGYNIDAYKYTESLLYKELNSQIQISIEDMNKINASDRMIMSCSNPNFISAINNNMLTTSKIKDSNNLVVKAGYFYQDGIERYFFANKNETVFEKLGSVDLIDTERIGNSVLFSESSTNYVPESSMYPKRMAKTCDVNFESINIHGSSILDSLTACDSFNYWKLFEMNISFVDGKNDIATKFTSITEYGYAIFDITKYIKNDRTLSLYKKDGLNIAIGKELKYKDISYNKSIMTRCEYELSKYKDCEYIEFNDIDEEYKYYIIITGNGILDDIIIADGNIEETYKLHTKNIDALGLNIIEGSTDLFTHKLLFDKEHNILDKLEITDDGEIICSSTMDWGLTKIWESREKINSLNLKQISIVKDIYLKTTTKFGYIESQPIYIRNIKSIRSLAVKVNELLTANMSGFNIELLTSKTLGGPYSTAGSISSDNVLSVNGKKIFNYIKLKTEMPLDKVIENIEIFADYIEVDGDVLRVNQNTSGELKTKIYDLTNTVNYSIKKVAIDRCESLSDIKIYARSYRNIKDNAIWTEWKELNINEDGTILNEALFEQYRFVQFKIALNNGNSLIKINSFEVEVI